MDRRLIEFLDKLNDAETHVAAWNCIVAFMRSLGARDFNYVLINGEPMPEFFSTMSDQWMTRYEEQNYAQLDHTLAHCMKNLRPITSKIEEDLKDVKNDDQRSQFFDECREEKIISAVSIPIRDGFGTVGGTCFSTDLSSEEFDKILAESGDIIQLAIMHAHVKLSQLRNTEEALRIGLSGREKEALRWLSVGLRNINIADRMRIKPVTVELHLANARKKLNTSTREHALAKAVQMRLISP